MEYALFATTDALNVRLHIGVVDDWHFTHKLAIGATAQDIVVGAYLCATNLLDEASELLGLYLDRVLFEILYLPTTGCEKCVDCSVDQCHLSLIKKSSNTANRRGEREYYHSVVGLDAGRTLGDKDLVATHHTSDNGLVGEVEVSYGNLCCGGVGLDDELHNLSVAIV